jgi:hypothetical protein
LASTTPQPAAANSGSISSARVSLRSWEQGGHVSEQDSAELVPGGAIEMFQARFFVVAA